MKQPDSAAVRRVRIWLAQNITRRITMSEFLEVRMVIELESVLLSTIGSERQLAPMLPDQENRMNGCRVAIS